MLLTLEALVPGDLSILLLTDTKLSMVIFENRNYKTQRAKDFENMSTSQVVDNTILFGQMDYGV